MEFYEIPGCSHCWRPVWWKVERMRGEEKPARNYLMDVKAVVDKYGALDKFKALAPTSSMDFETAMEEDWVLDKSKAPERDYLMDFKRVTAEFEVEVLNKLSRTWTRATSSKSLTFRRRRT